MAEVKRGAGRGILRFASQSVCISLWHIIQDTQIVYAMLACYVCSKGEGSYNHGGRPHNMSSLGPNYLVFEDRPIMFILNFAPTLLCWRTPTRRRCPTKKLDYSPLIWGTGSTISAIFIPQNIPYSACSPYLRFRNFRSFDSHESRMWYMSTADINGFVIMYTVQARPVCTPEEQLSGMVKAMSLTPDDCEVLVISQAAAMLTKDKSSPVLCLDILLNCCEADWRFSNTATICAVSLCNVDVINSTDSGSFRTLWLKKLQSLFLRKCVNMCSRIICCA